MKNSTYNESRVVALSLTLPDIDINRLDELWDYMEETALDEVCYNASYNIREMAYYSTYVHILDAVQGHQVMRHYMVELRARYNRMSDFRYTEVCQHWLCPDGTIVVMAKSRRDLKLNSDLWWFGSKMSIKHGDYGHVFEHSGHDFFGERSQLIYVDGVDNKLFYRFGQYIKEFADNARYDMSQNQFDIVFGQNGEYLAKNNPFVLNYLLANEYNNKAVEKRLPQIRIATKHHFDLSSRLRNWLVYLDWLEEKNKDLHNPHFICNDSMFDKFQREIRPKWEEHKRRVAETLAAQRREEMQRRMEEERRRWEEMQNDPEYIARREAQMIEEMIRKEDYTHARNKQKLERTEDMALWEEEYAKAKRAYLGIGFMSDDGTIKFHVLQNVHEFYEEAEAMVHCVFHNPINYFERNDVLILSATDASTNERLATIEINIKTLKVVDVRAKYDRKPERESDIMQALNTNMSMFKIKKAI